MKRKILASLLSLCLLVGLLPTTALAAWGDTFFGGNPFYPVDPYGNDPLPAYFYVLDPNVADEDTRAPENFYFIGRGSVSGIGDPGSHSGDLIQITDYNDDGLQPPGANDTQTIGSGGDAVQWTTYPDITFEGKNYVYAGKNPGAQHTYTVRWYRYSSSSGYNIYYHDGSGTYKAFESTTPYWHVDGQIEFNDKASVTYKVSFPGGSAPSNVTSTGNPTTSATYTAYVNENTPFQDVSKPSMEASKTYGGETYTFDGWYRDAACTQPIDDEEEITGNILAYGQYVKDDPSKPSSIDIKIYVDGQEITPYDSWTTYIRDISVAPGTASGESSITVGVDKLTFPFKYIVYNAADITITPNTGYAFQGMSGSFISGATFWHSPSQNGSTWTIDNISGGSTLSIYLSTLYTVAYDVPVGTNPINDPNTYVTGEGISATTINSNSFAGFPVDQPKAGDWKNPNQNTTVNLSAVPDGCAGWYTTSTGETLHAASYTGTEIRTAAESSGSSTPTVIDCYAIANTTSLAVDKTVTSVGQTQVTDQMRIPEAVTGDTISYQILVENTGNVALSNVVVNDTLWTAGQSITVDGIPQTTTGDKTYTIASLPPEQHVTITYTYMVPATAAGSAVSNTAAAAAGSVSAQDTASVSVKSQHTINVEVVNGTASATDLSNGTITVNHGDSVNISFAANTGFALDTVTVDGSPDSLTGNSYSFTNVTGNHTIKVTYAEDDNNDHTPDKYQVTIRYTAAGGGSIAESAMKEETLTITDSTGKRATSGTVTATGSTAEADSTHFFSHWTKQVNSGTAEETTLPATTGSIPLTVNGNDVITFTAYFTEKSFTLDVEKVLKKVGAADITDTSSIPLAKVGDDITWEITVTNTGNQTQENIQVTDLMSGTSGSAVLTAGAGVTINGDGTATIASLAPQASAVITAVYTVQPSDAGKELNNTAAVSVNDEKKDQDTPDKPVITEKSGLTVDKAVTYVGQTAVTNQANIPSAMVGDTVSYQIQVKNTGNVALSDVVVSDTLWTANQNITVDGSSAAVASNKTYTIATIAPGSSVTIDYTYTVTESDGTAGRIVNKATAKAAGDLAGEATATVSISGMITITPADITIYMGGDNGYDAVVGGNGNTTSSNSMPTPLFYVDLPNNLKVDVESIVLTGAAGREWRFVTVGTDGFGKALYSISSTGFEGQDPVRVTYKDEAGNYHISDSFNPSAVHELHTEYDINIYSGNAGTVQAVVNNSTYDVATGTGTLSVRAVDNTIINPVISVETVITRPVAPGSAAITAPENTTYTLNDTTVPVSKEGVGLLFDNIIDDQTHNRTEALITAIRDTYGISIREGNYQAQYLDLVDADNGNAWVTASGNVTICWGYPAGTGSYTDFALYHFTDLHRDGTNSGFDISDIAHSDIEAVHVTKTANGITFQVEPGNFSPFVLVWNASGTTPIWPVDPGENPQNPNDLNTDDHIAYIAGYQDGTVRPDASITRAEVATIFFRLLTEDARKASWSQSNNFSDVAAGSWYCNAISTLSNMGILSGYEDGTFRPDAPITRAEFAKIAVGFFDLANSQAKNTFIDVASGSWYEDIVAAAAELGLIQGYEDHTFRPNQAISRAEACTIVNRILGRAPDKEHLLAESVMITWPDNPKGAWYYADIQEATNSHDYKWLGDIEQWLKKLEERDWAAFEKAWSSAYSAPGGEVMN